MRYKEILEACWTGYEQQGMKKKGDRTVPNCVPVEEVKIGPEITSKDLLFKAAAMAMRDASHEGISLDYEQAIRQASKIYGIPYTPSELPRLLAQRAEIDRQLALLKQGKQVAKARRQEKLAPTPAGADEYWRTHALPTDRIKPATKSLEETETALAEDLKKWFKEKWVRFGPDGKIRGDCARGSSKEGKPKCLPQAKAQALGKKGRASSAAKKRREDPNPERRGAARNVATKVKETVTDVRAGMAQIYRRLAPKIERYRDSFLAGQLYDELENYAELHGAEREFKQMMNGARNRAHMEYDTNPGGFHNWFWFLPFEDENVAEGFEYASKVQHPKYGPGQVVKVYSNGQITVNFPNYPDPIDKKPGVQSNFMPGDSDYKSLKSGMAEGTDDIKKRMSKLEALALAANRAGDDAKCKMYQQKIQSLKQKLSQSIGEAVTLDRARVPDYPHDSATIKHRTDTAKAILSDPKSDPDSRKEASTILATLKQVDEEQDACYRKVKSRYKVWPSAYASGALVQCRKKGAANWGNKKK
jgi:hypothetical protein